jgi:hypothetical protein
MTFRRVSRSGKGSKRSDNSGALARRKCGIALQADKGLAATTASLDALNRVAAKGHAPEVPAKINSGVRAGSADGGD